MATYKRKNNRLIILVFIALVFIVGVSILYASFMQKENTIRVISASTETPTQTPSETPTPEQTTAAILPTEEVAQSLRVYVSGEVKTPGVYELAVGSRVIDAVEAAGGLTELANLDVNMARIIIDAEQISIPNKEETVSPQSVDVAPQSSLEVAAQEPQTDTPTEPTIQPIVNINTASLEEVMTLPGIGEVIGKEIITYRENNGGFKTKEDIMNVNHIKQKNFDKIKDFIVIK